VSESFTLLRLQWIPVNDQSGAKLGSHLIVSDQDAPAARPYMAEIIQWGTHWRGPAESGYYALTRELPDGERLAAEWHARQKRLRLFGD
jgi:hypothetical protein